MVKRNTLHAVAQPDAADQRAGVSLCPRDWVPGLVTLIKESELAIERDDSKILDTHCPQLLKGSIWQLARDANTKQDRTSAILVEQSIEHYQGAADTIIRARRVVERHNPNPDARQWFTRLRFDEPRFPGVDACRHAFRAPSDLAERVAGLADDLGWKARGPLICLCMVRTVTTHRYGHDLQIYQAWLDEFDRTLLQREEQALQLVRDTHARLVTPPSYRGGMLAAFLDAHPELEAADD